MLLGFSFSFYPFHAVFMRSPYIAAERGNAGVIAKSSDGPAVAVREGKWLVTAFHPELTSDLRFHRHFLEMSKDIKKAFRPSQASQRKSLIPAPWQ